MQIPLRENALMRSLRTKSAQRMFHVEHREKGESNQGVPTRRAAPRAKGAQRPERSRYVIKRVATLPEGGVAYLLSNYLPGRF